MVYQLDDYRSRDSDVSTRMMPPHSIEAEESVLGSILFDAESLERVGRLVPEHFYATAHQQIFRAMVDLRNADERVDLISVCMKLESRSQLEKIGGRERLGDLFELSVGSVNIDAHAELITAKSKRRALITACQELSRMAYDQLTPWPDVIKTAEDKIFALAECSVQKGLQPLSDVLVGEAERLDRASKGEDQPGVMTGFYDFDAITKGLNPQSLSIIAGRPAMGKSAFAAALAKGSAELGHTVAIFSLEMTDSEIAQRLMACESGIEADRLQVGQIRVNEWESVGHSIARLSTLPIFIDESQDITPSTILSQSRALKSRTGNLGLVVIDYLHLMLNGSDDEVRELGKITRACKKMARALDCPVILLSQLSRANESRQDKRPTLADLRGSGSIEQDADMVAFLYRDEYYNRESEDQGIAEVNIAKQRNGPTGTIKLLFEPQFSRFRNIARTNPNAGKYPGDDSYQRSGQNSPQQAASSPAKAVSSAQPVAAGSSGQFDESEWEEIE